MSIYDVVDRLVLWKFINNTQKGYMDIALYCLGEAMEINQLEELFNRVDEIKTQSEEVKRRCEELFESLEEREY